MRALRRWWACRARFILLPLLVLVVGALQAQELPRGYPLSRYFSPATYQAGDQNWAVAQDHRGLIYVGNDGSGLLEYDGARFVQVPLSDRLVRSLAVGPDGIVYVGLTHDFGRVVPDAKGQLQFESLLPTVEGTVPKFPTVFRVFSVGQEVVFCALTAIFSYSPRHGTTRVVEPDVRAQFFVHQVGNKLLGWTADNQPFIYQHDTVRLLSLHAAPGSSFLRQTYNHLYGVVPAGQGRLLLAFHPVGLCYYDTLHETISRVGAAFAPSLQALVDSGALVYAMRAFRNGRIGAAVLFSDSVGYVEFDPDGTHEVLYGRLSGLQRSGVTDFCESSDGGLWLMHQLGFTCMEMSSPLRRFGAEIGILFHPYALAELAGQLYLGTNQGLQRVCQRGGVTQVTTLAGADDRIWQLVPYTDPFTGRRLLLARGMKYCYEVEGSRVRPFVFAQLGPDGRYRAVQNVGTYLPGFTLHPLRHDSTRVYVGTNHWLLRLRRLREGCWVREDVVFSQQPMDDVRVIAEGLDSTLYVTTYASGCYALRGAYGDTCRVEALGPRAAVDLKQAQVCAENGEVYFQTVAGLFVYDSSRDTVIPAPLPLAPGGGVNMMQIGPNRLLAQRYSQETGSFWMEYYRDLHDTAGAVVRMPFRHLRGECQGALRTQEGLFYLGYSQAVYCYDPHAAPIPDFPFRAFVRSVHDLRADTLLFGGTYSVRDSTGAPHVVLEQPETMRLKLPYRCNSLRFALGSNSYVGAPIQYQFLLTGNDDAWSGWTSLPEVVYTNVSIGAHTLRVRARDAYGRLSSEALYSFTIRPPYYLAWYAILLYGLLLLSSATLVMFWRNQRFRRARRRLEAMVAARTEEVEQQKKRIEEQNVQIMDSIAYAATMQQAVLPSLATVRGLFPDSFVLYLPRDTVSGDFYWVGQHGARIYCCIADCTGHGVPAGFMSMMAMTMLQQVCSDMPQAAPGELLGAIRSKIIQALHQSMELSSIQDGFDCALFTLEPDRAQVCYAGASMPLIQVHAGELTVHKPDRMPVGMHVWVDRPFNTCVFTLSEGDMLYACSDGYVDQFGGSSGRRYTSARLNELLCAVSELPLPEQMAQIRRAHYSWRGAHGQVDDILVFGFRYHAGEAKASQPVG